MADVAHELRTPLTVLQGNLRPCLMRLPLSLNEIAVLYDDTRHLSRLVDDLRELALAEAGNCRCNRGGERGGGPARRGGQLAPAAEAQSVTLATEADANLQVTADADAWRRCCATCW